MTATETPTINLLDPQFYVDPYPAYRWLRDHDPVHWDPVHRIWGVSRYADVVEVAKQTSYRSSSAAFMISMFAISSSTIRMVGRSFTTTSLAK